MIEKLETKIDEVLDYIISKPVEQITGEDFAILTTELKERRFRDESDKQRVKNADILRHLMDFSHFNPSNI